MVNKLNSFSVGKMTIGQNLIQRVVYLILTISVTSVFGQENLSYQKPPQEILELVDVPLPPSVLLDNDKEVMVLLYRHAYKSIA